MLCVSILTHEQRLQAIKHTWKGYCTMHFVRELFVYSAQMLALLWGIERSGFFNDRGKWVKGFENQRV